MYESTKVLAAWPGVGKTYLKRQYGDLVDDSDDWETDLHQPLDDVLERIIANIATGKLSLILPIANVLNMLEEAGINYYLVYPENSCKEQWLERIRKRDNSEFFVKFLNHNWDDMQDVVKRDTGGKHIAINSQQYLTDVVQCQFDQAAFITKRNNHVRTY